MRGSERRQLMGNPGLSRLESAAALDPLAALIVWKQQRQRSGERKRRRLAANEPPPLPPSRATLREARWAMQYAVAAYGVIGQVRRVAIWNPSHRLPS